MVQNIKDLENALEKAKHELEEKAFSEKLEKEKKLIGTAWFYGVNKNRSEGYVSLYYVENVYETNKKICYDFKQIGVSGNKRGRFEVRRNVILKTEHNPITYYYKPFNKDMFDCLWDESENMFDTMRKLLLLDVPWTEELSGYDKDDEETVEEIIKSSDLEFVDIKKYPAFFRMVQYQRLPFITPNLIAPKVVIEPIVKHLIEKEKKQIESHSYSSGYAEWNSFNADWRRRCAEKIQVYENFLKEINNEN